MKDKIMKKIMDLFYKILLIGGMSIYFSYSSFAGGKSTCSAEGDLKYICGLIDVEDMIFIPKTPWIFASGVGFSKIPGSLKLINSQTKEWHNIYPTSSVVMGSGKNSTCPAGAPDPKVFVAHGIDIRARKNGNYKLFVVNHGGREAIEIFDVDATATVPVVKWKSCVVIPKKAYINSVASLSDGGFLATKMFDPTIAGGIEAIGRGENMGSVLEWHPESGFSVVPKTSVMGANGLAVSPDGKWMYLAAWGSKEIIRLSRGAGAVQRVTVELDFHPDNLRWSPAGELIIAGQKSIAELGCGEKVCEKGWSVVKLNVKDLTVEKILTRGDEAALKDTSVAVEGQNTLWLGSFHGDRVGYISLLK